MVEARLAVWGEIEVRKPGYAPTDGRGAWGYQFGAIGSVSDLPAGRQSTEVRSFQTHWSEYWRPALTATELANKVMPLRCTWAFPFGGQFIRPEPGRRSRGLCGGLFVS